MAQYPIADLHCDLLAYLGKEENRFPNALECRCSLPQLKAGGVLLQTTAVWTETKRGSAALAEKEFAWFAKLNEFGLPQLKTFEMPKSLHIIASIENASGLAEEDEPLERAFERLERYMKLAGPILYITITWHHENRFGGGNMTQIGLKKDGEALLDYLNGKGIGVDFSHTSDALAWDILNYIDKKGLAIPILASHSNFRAVTDQERNLPDALAIEIFKRGGVIGLNVIHDFVGKKGFEDFRRHVEHGLALGGEKQLCLGADFFYDGDYPKDHPVFFDEFGDSSCYPRLLTLLGDHFERSFLEGLASKNLSSYFRNTYADRR